MNFEQDRKIDPDQLDVEWLRQPDLFGKYAEEAAKSQEVMDKAKDNIEVIRAEIAHSIRSNPTDYGMEKITENSINEIILTEKDYQQAQKDYISAKFENEILKSAVKSMDQKKVALENLVKLHGQNYFAGPTVPRNLKEEFEHFEELKGENVKDKIKESIKKRRRRKRS